MTCSSSSSSLQGVLATLLALASVGCAALPWPQRRVPPTAVATDDGLLDLRGVVHVHTRDSHDSPGRITDVIRAARKSGVVWVALTEHTRPGGRPAAGAMEGVILIPGYELRGWGGSILALGIEALPEGYPDPIRAIQSIHARGGLALLAHLDTARIAPEEYRAAELDGVEMANLHADALKAGRLRLAVEGLLLPAPTLLKRILGASASDLAWWDTLSPAAIVGGTDVHAKVRVLGPVGGTVDSYARIFRLLTTHVLADQLSQAGVLRALRAGRSYVAFEAWGRVDHFRFRREKDTFELMAPLPATLKLICDGVHAGAALGTRARLAIPPRANRCRAEAWRGDRRWIVTSELSAQEPASPRARAAGRLEPGASAH